MQRPAKGREFGSGKGWLSLRLPCQGSKIRHDPVIAQLSCSDVKGRLKLCDRLARWITGVTNAPAEYGRDQPQAFASLPEQSRGSWSRCRLQTPGPATRFFRRRFHTTEQR